MSKVCLIEFNEANFALIKKYVNDFTLPNIEKLLALNNTTTSAELEYSKLEPWIQWTSVHTGKSYDEHKVFRLGDINEFEGEQIFEKIEKMGYSVGVICAMNAKNDLVNPKYFIPDPWTTTNVDSNLHSQQIYRAIKQAVNDNANGKMSKRTYLDLLRNILRYSNVKNWPQYSQLFYKSRKKKWLKALFLDLFLSDLHLKYSKRHNPDFTVLFLNGLAHIQHHYFFNSKYYTGQNANPKWYISEKEDPILDALKIYDIIFGQIFQRFSDHHLIVATGLSQDPYTHTKFYYRLTEHERFIHDLGIKPCKVSPRMTRDFLLEFQDETECRAALTQLKDLHVNDEPLFGMIDNRGKSLFITLTYDKEIKPKTFIKYNDKNIDLYSKVDFVAIKNGHHCSRGYVFSNRALNLQKGSHVKMLGENLLLNFT